MTNEISKLNFEPTNLQEAMEFAKLLADSDLAPKDYKGKPGNVLNALILGKEIGLKPMQAIQNIAIINGRPTVWGDSMIGLVQNHPLCEYIHEEIKGDTAYCTVKRLGEEEYTYSFSKQDAKTANLLNKPGPWQQYPNRMLQMRARAFALRDKFADILKGIAMREEVMDYEVKTKSAKKEKAQSQLSNIIEGKTIKDAVSPHLLDKLLNEINNACSDFELSSIVGEAKDLNEMDKVKLRQAYRARKDALKKDYADPSEIEVVEVSEADKVKFQLLQAKSVDTLDVAADLINTLPADQQTELLAIYQERKAQLN